MRKVWNAKLKSIQTQILFNFKSNTKRIIIESTVIIEKGFEKLLKKLFYKFFEKKLPYIKTQIIDKNAFIKVLFSKFVSIGILGILSAVKLNFETLIFRLLGGIRLVFVVQLHFQQMA